MSQLLASGLIGRDEALSDLREALSRTQQGAGSLLVVRGEAGVGKSRLVRAAVDTASSFGMTVFSGRTTPVGAPFRALTSALLSYGRRHSLPKDHELAPFRTHLSVLVPEWQDASTRSTSLPQGSLPLMAEGVARLLRAAGPNGTLLTVEDVHWADPETLHVLDHLADTAVGERLMVIATMRPEESPASAWAAAACSRRTARTLELCRLADDDTTAMIHACLGTSSVPSELVDFVVGASEGLPLLVEDLLAGLVDSGALVRRHSRWQVPRPLRADVPRTFAQTVEERLRRLDGPARRIVASAAMIGRRFDWQLLAEITGESHETVLDALRAGVALQIVVPDPAGGLDDFWFRHALSREVVLSDLLPPERRALAAAAAEAVERTRPDLPGDWLSIAATLHADGGRPGHAARLLLEAGRRALASGALRSAEDTLRRARRLVVDEAAADQVDFALTEMLALAGRVDEAFGVGETLLERVTGEPARDVHLRLARAAVAAGAVERAERHLAAVAAPGEELPAGDVLRALLALSQGRTAAAEQLAQRALRVAEHRGEWAVACEALEALGRGARAAHASSAEGYFVRAQQIAEEHGLVLWRGRALHELGTIDLMESGRRDRLEAARQEAEAVGDLVTAAHVDLHLGILHAHHGEQDAAARALESAVQLATSIGLDDLGRVATAQLGYTHALAGRRTAALACIEAVRAAPATDAARAVVDGLAEPFCCLLDDDSAGAVELIDRAVHELTDDSWPQWGVRALLHAVDGRDDAMHAVMDRVGEHGPQRLILAYLQFARAVSLGRSGEAAGAAASFAQADASLGWQAAHRPFCYRLVAEAALRDGWGDPVRWLVTCLDAFPEAPSFTAACRNLIRAAGAPVPRRGRGDAVVPAGLRELGVTSREVDVLILVAEGLGNQAIAGRLHLSRRTVESHVARLLAKTGSSSRSELAALANSVRPPS